MMSEKDGWDKFDILLKLAIPAAVAVIAWIWNADRTDRETAASMTQIAIGILSEKPAEDSADPLRDWAIAVLQNPIDPPVLSAAAAKQLKTSPLSTAFDKALSEWKVMPNGFTLSEDGLVVPFDTNRYNTPVIVPNIE